MSRRALPLRVFQLVLEVGMTAGIWSMLILGFKVWKCISLGTMPCCIQSVALITPATPAAASVCAISFGCQIGIYAYPRFSKFLESPINSSKFCKLRKFGEFHSPND
jgi:hypothetical protein